VKSSGNLDLIPVVMNPLFGIPGEPQSQFIHFNIERNTIVTKHNFLLNNKNILLKI
jgi:hypothetical protein